MVSCDTWKSSSPVKNALEPPRDLLWRPQQLEFGCDARQISTLCQLAALRAMSPIPCCLVGPSRPVVLLTTIALDLSADGGRRSPEDAGDRADRETSHYGTRDLLSLGQGERRGGTAALLRPYAARLRQNPLNRRVRSIKQLGDVLEALTLLPALPHQRLLAVAVVDPRSLLHRNTPSAQSSLQSESEGSSRSSVQAHGHRKSVSGVHRD
jgi:hypothetical protein